MSSTPRSLPALPTIKEEYDSDPSSPADTLAEPGTAYDGDLDMKPLKKRPTKGRVFQCTGFPGCNMLFTRLEHLARHKRKHTGERPFTCPYCSKNFSRLDNLRQHKQTVHAYETFLQMEGLKQRAHADTTPTAPVFSVNNYGNAAPQKAPPYPPGAMMLPLGPYYLAQGPYSYGYGGQPLPYYPHPPPGQQPPPAQLPPLNGHRAPALALLELLLLLESTAEVAALEPALAPPALLLRLPDPHGTKAKRRPRPLALLHLNVHDSQRTLTLLTFLLPVLVLLTAPLPVPPCTLAPHLAVPLLTPNLVLPLLPLFHQLFNQMAVKNQHPRFVALLLNLRIPPIQLQPAPPEQPPAANGLGRWQLKDVLNEKQQQPQPMEVEEKPEPAAGEKKQMLSVPTKMPTINNLLSPYDDKFKH